jgi:uncharacterized protein (TIGR00251 family)
MHPPRAWRLQVRVQPRASRSRIVGRHGEALKIQVQAPPVGGAANAAVEEILAATLGLPRRAVRVLQGFGSRDKIVEIDCADPDRYRRRLQALLEGGVDKELGRD